MKTMSKSTVFQIVNSSLWITVLVVRVGCIIEAHPSPNNSNGHKVSHHDELYDRDDQTVELETAASHSFISSPRNGLLGGGESGSISKKQQLPTSLFQLGGLSKPSEQQTLADEERAALISTRASSVETTTTYSTSPPPALHSKQQQQDESSINRSQNDDDKSNTSNEESDDSCSGKADGYYQNLGSGCTSYFFCAAGYQATYVCPIGSKFNGKRCENDYVCPTTTTDGHHISNDCENKSNGYYPANSRINVGKYFYCFQKAKVIELQCDPGKMFVKDKCVLVSSTSHASTDKGISQGGAENAAATKEMNREVSSTEVLAATEVNTCSKKSNGFYQDVTSHCEKYYYCIGGEKTELRCQDEYVFNGDICVHHSRYECPHAFVQSQEESQQSELKLDGVGSIDQRRSTRATSSGTGLTTRTRISSSYNDGSKRETVTETGKLPIISGQLTPLENDYYSRRDSNDRRMGTTRMNPSHLNAS